MDNQQNNQNVPQQSPPSTTQTPPPPPTNPTPTNPYQTNNQAPKSKKTVWIVLSIIATILVILALLVIFVGIPALAHSQRRARAIAAPGHFFTTAEQNDNKAAYRLFVDSDIPDTQQFVDTAIKAVGKSCTTDSTSLTIKSDSNDNRTARIKAHCKSDGATNWEFNMLYNNDKKDWVINKLVFSGGRAISTAPKTVTPKKSSTLACLQPSDVHFFVDITPIDVNQFFYSNSIFFNADATSYQHPDVSSKHIQKFVTFYKQNSLKAFTYHIKGSVNESDQSGTGKKLANSRALKIEKTLEKGSVPKSRIVIDDPISVVNKYSTGASRNVSIEVKADPNCDTASTSSNL